MTLTSTEARTVALSHVMASCEDVFESDGWWVEIDEQGGEESPGGQRLLKAADWVRERLTKEVLQRLHRDAARRRDDIASIRRSKEE